MGESASPRRSGDDLLLWNAERLCDVPYLMCKVKRCLKHFFVRDLLLRLGGLSLLCFVDLFFHVLQYITIGTLGKGRGDPLTLVRPYCDLIVTSYI